MNTKTTLMDQIRKAVLSESMDLSTFFDSNTLDKDILINLHHKIIRKDYRNQCLIYVCSECNVQFCTKLDAQKHVQKHKQDYPIQNQPARILKVISSSSQKISNSILNPNHHDQLTNKIIAKAQIRSDLSKNQRNLDIINSQDKNQESNKLGRFDGQSSKLLKHIEILEMNNLARLDNSIVKDDIKYLNNQQYSHQLSFNNSKQTDTDYYYRPPKRMKLDPLNNLEQVVKICQNRRINKFSPKHKQPINSHHFVGYKKMKCKYCFYRSNWKGDLVRHVTKEHNGIPNQDILYLDESFASNTFENYELTFGRLLRSRLLISLIEYKDVSWPIALLALANNISRLTQVALNENKDCAKTTNKLMRISNEFVRLVESTSLHHSLLTDGNAEIMPFLITSEVAKQLSRKDKRREPKREQEKNVQHEQLLSCLNNALNETFRLQSEKPIVTFKTDIKCLDLSSKNVNISIDKKNNISKDQVSKKDVVTLKRTYEEMLQDVEKTLQKGPKKIRCSLCSPIWTYNSISSFARHCDLHRMGDGYQCMKCNSSGHFKNVMTLHNIIKHNNAAHIRRVRKFGEPYPIFLNTLHTNNRDYRNKTRFNRYSFLKLNRQKQRKVITCSQCQFSTHAWSKFIVHKQIHRKRKGAFYKCLHCNAYFKEKCKCAKTV